MNYLVFDVGGTAIKYALMTENAEIIEKGEVLTPEADFDLYIGTLTNIYYKYTDIKGIALSLPGKIDSESGHCYSSGNLHYCTGKNIAKILNSKFNIPVSAENDGKCAALAEVWKGSLSDCDDGLVVIIGTMIGGGVIKSKALHRGKEFIAGEFSFIVNNTKIKKGENLDIFGSSCGVPRGLCRPVAKVKNLPENEVNGRKFFDWANSGDEDALKILDDYCYELALNLHNLQHIYNPEKIAIGGGISSQELLFEYLERNISYIQENFFENFLPLSKPRIVKCKFKNDANLLGALYHYMTIYQNQI